MVCYLPTNYGLPLIHSPFLSLLHIHDTLISADLVTSVDVPEENIATMLTYLELCPSRSWVKLRQPVNATCHIQCYGGPAHLTALAKQVGRGDTTLYRSTLAAT